MRYRVPAITLLFMLAACATALAAGPLKGKTYRGSTSSSGVSSEGQQLQLKVTGPILLTVAGSGKTVTVRFSSPYPILYCRPNEQLHSQSTTPAKISASGAFRATIAERFAAGSGPPAIVQVLSGRFSGRTVKGTLRTEAGECGGVASFSATAP
jgi:hypothetical protein